MGFANRRNFREQGIVSGIRVFIGGAANQRIQTAAGKPAELLMGPLNIVKRERYQMIQRPPDTAAIGRLEIP